MGTSGCRISCPEAVLWATNCPLFMSIVASGLQLLSSGFRMYFLVIIKYSHDYPQQASPRARGSSSFFLSVVFFSGRLPFALYLVRLLAVVQLSLLSRCFIRVALYLSHWPPVWLPWLPSHWSGTRTVLVTLVLRLLALLSFGSTGSASSAWLSREPSDLSGLDQDDPPWLDAGCPLSA